MVYTFFDKKTSGGNVRNKNMLNEQLAEELHKPITRKFKKQKVHSSFNNKIWGADLVDIQLISKFNKRIRFLLCVIDIFSKYALVFPLKDKKDITITNAFQKILYESRRINKGSEFYNRPLKSWLEKNHIEMYSTHNRKICSS